MINNIKNIFINEKQNLGNFFITRDKENIDFPSFATVSKAIEATKGEKCHIYEKINDTYNYIGEWKEYILQK